MTIQSDLEKAVAAAKSALGTYESFSVSTQDETAKQMFKGLSSDMERHINLLIGRLNHITESNQMNKPLS